MQRWTSHKQKYFLIPLPPKLEKWEINKNKPEPKTLSDFLAPKAT
jgi:hypothetical protein